MRDERRDVSRFMWDRNLQGVEARGMVIRRGRLGGELWPMGGSFFGLVERTRCEDARLTLNCSIKRWIYFCYFILVMKHRLIVNRGFVFITFLLFASLVRFLRCAAPNALSVFPCLNVLPIFPP